MRTPPVSPLRPLSFSLARLTSSFAVAAAISLAGATAARAATLQWDPSGSHSNPPTNGGGSWSTSAPFWFNGASDVVWNNANGDVAQFNGTGGFGPFIVTLDSNITADSLLFNTDGYTILGSGTTLTLNSGNVSVDSGVTATLAATVGGSSGLTLGGGGTLELTQGNTFTGTTTVNGGSDLRVDAANSTGSVVLNGSTLELANGVAYAQSIALNDGATLLGGQSAASRSNGVLTVAAGAAVHLNSASGQTLTIGPATTPNVLTGGGVGVSNATIQVGGAADGTVLISDTNNVVADWDVAVGTLQANRVDALGSGSVTVESGATLQYNDSNNNVNVVNPIILNGGTLRQIPQLQINTNSVVTVNSASTIDIAATGNFGKIFINAGITGTGDLTKDGHGILQIVQANPTYSGNWTINGGFVEDQNNLGVGVGAVTVNNGGELVSSSVQIPNAITIGSAGAVISFDNGNTGNFGGAINAANDFHVGMRDFYQNVARSGTISGPISGPGQLIVDAPSGPATLTLAGDNPNWTGGVSVPSNVLLHVTLGGINSLGTGSVAATGGLFVTATPDLPAPLPTPGFSARYVNSALITTGIIGGFDFGLGVNTPLAIRNEATIDLVNGTGTQPNPPIPGFNQDHNGELWTGVLNVTTGGSYLFGTASDDASLLYVDGQQLVQNDFAQGVTERTGTVTLGPGLHSLIVKYGQGTGGGGMHATYNGPDTGGSEILIGSIDGTVTSNGSTILGTTTVTRDIPLGATGGFDLAAVDATFTGALTFQAGTVFNVTGVTGSELLTQAGPVTLNGVHNFTIGIDQVVNNIQNASAGADMVISGSIGEAVPGSGITKLGPRTLTLTGANTYTGVTTVNEGTLQLGSPVPNTGVSAAGLIINSTIGASTVRLLADEQLPDALTLTVTGSTTNPAIFDANGFTETVSGLVVNSSAGSSTGVLLGSGTLVVTGDIMLNNNRAASNNNGREVLISSFGNYTATANGGTLDLGGTTRNITVETTNTGANIANSDATIEANIADGAINKLGSRTLILTGSNTYAGGTILTSGIVRATGPAGATSTALGTGPVTFDGGSLQLRNDGVGSNGNVNYGNDVNIDPSQSTVSFDVNNNGSTNTGNALSLGHVTLGAQTVNVTGGNNYSLGFNSVTLTDNPTLNPSSANLTLNNVGESGGSHSLTKLAGSSGVLILSGNSTYTGGTVIPANSGPLRLVPSVGTTNTPSGSGTVSLGSGTTLQITPTLTSLSSTGAVAGGLTVKYYDGGQTINGSEVFELPTAVSTASVLADGTFFNRPATITPASGTNMLAVYSGLLNITTGGTYNFQTAAGDESQLVIDGVPVVSVNAGGGLQPFTNGTTTPVTLSAGFHTISMEAFNAGSGGGVRVRYQGADTGNVLQVIPASQFYSVPALLNVGRTGAPVSITSGPATIDSRGSAFDSGIASLTLGAGITVTVANAGGLGALNVNGNIVLQGAGTLNLASSALNLSGDFSDGGNNFTISKTGAGALILTGAKAFGGALNISQGGVQVTNAASLGGTGNGTVVSSAVTPLTSTTSNGSPNVTGVSTAGLIVGAFVSGTGIPAGTTIAAITSGSTLTLSNNATASGSPTLNYTIGGTLDLNGVALNAEPLTIGGGGSASTSAALYNSSASAASESGPVTVGSTGTKIGGYGDITLGGTLSGIAANDLTKTGANTLTIGGSNLATFLGTLTVSQGTVKLGNDNALGATGGTAGTTVSSGAVLDLNGHTTGETISITGVGLANLGGANTLGALINSNAGAATDNGPITLAAASSIGSPLAGGGDMTLNGVISGAFALTKVGPNTLTLGAVNTYTGAGTVQLGTLVLSLGGTVATESAMSVNPSATLTLDDSGTNNTTGSRLGSPASLKHLNLIGGNLNILGKASANTLEDLGSGALFIDSQNSIVTLTPGSGTSNVEFKASGTGTAANVSGLQRSGAGSVKGTALFRGTGLGTAAIGVAGAGGTSSIVFGGTIPTVGQAGVAGSSDRAIIPWALVDTSATGSGSSFATYSATNGLQALQPGDFATTITANPVKISNIVASSALNAPAGATTSINSLTLQAGGGLIIGSGAGISLDSGGILATASANITGAGTLTSTLSSSTNREVIVQTAGAATNLTIGTPIAVNNGLTKSGNGTLTLTTQDQITGAIRLNAGKTVLNGGANTIAYGVTAPPAVGSSASTPSGNTLILDNGATLDLFGNDERFGGLSSNSVAGTNLPGTSGTITNSSATTANLRIGMKSFTATSLPTAITGNINFERDGGTTLPVNTAWTYTGSTTLDGGVLTLVDAGALPNTSSLAIHRASLKFDDTGLQAGAHINPAAPVALDGGAISFFSRSNTADTLTLGAMTLNSGASVISQTLGGTTAPTTANTGTSTVTIASLARSEGATINFVATANGNVSLGSNPRVLLGTGTPTLTNGMVGGWATIIGYNSGNPAAGNTSVDFATYDQVAGFRPINYTTVLAPGNNVNLAPKDAGAASSTLDPGGDTINSLRIGALGTTTSNTLNFDASGGLLNLQSGGLLSTSTNSPRAIGATPDSGQLTAGGSASTGTSELFIHNGNNTLTINAGIVDNPNGAKVAVVLDAVSLTGSTIQLAGSNTYSGTTYVNGVTATLNSPNLAIPGNLVISGGTQNGGDSQTTAAQTVRLLAANQIATTANVTINGGGQLDLNNLTNTINNLTFAADGGSNGNIGPSVITGTGTLTVNGNITATNLLQATTIPVLSGNLNLPVGVHDVAIGTVPGAPGQVGLEINSVMGGGGSLNVTSGVLGLGSSVSTTAISLAAGATLNVSNFSPTIGTLTGAGTVTDTASTAVLTVGNDGGSGVFSGLIAAPMSIVKTGSGTQTFSAPQSYTSLAVNGGAMVLGGTNTLGTQALNNGSLTLAASTSLTLTAHTGGPANVKALVVNGNGPSSLSIAANSQIDLTNNAAVFHGTTQAAVNALLFSGQYSGPNGYWDGPGINSSSAANDPNGVTTLGVIDNAEFGFTDFAGVHNLDGTEILVKYTYFGDTDLNGVVNVSDFSQFVVGLTHQGPAEWLNGDFDNNGVVNVVDFSLFVNGLVGQTGQLRPDDTALVTQEIDQMAAQVGIDPGSLGSSTVDASSGADAGRAVVPEPGSIGLLAVGALGLLGRRRRKA